jgi:glycosyltransferase involved in cell wall biosynthesis
MKLAILGSRGIPAAYGGFETFAEELSSRLVQNFGADVTVYCEENGKPAQAVYRGVKLVHLKAPQCGPLSTLAFDLECFWHARRRFDILYMLGYGSALFFFIPRFYGQKIWVNMDGIEWARPKWSWLAKIWFRAMEGLAVRVANLVIADAEAIRQRLKKRHRRMAPCSVIPYGAHLVEAPPSEELLAEWQISPNEYFLIVCRLEPENHVLEILEGFSQSDSYCPMIVVGNIKKSSIYVRNLLKLADHRIRFIGTVYDQKKLQALRYYARAYFHGHSVGGTNPSLLEALGCGNIIVAHDNDFNREVSGSTAFFYQTSEDIKKIIVQLEVLSEKERKSMQLKAQKIIEEKYNWEAITKSYLELLGNLHSIIPTGFPGLKNDTEYGIS